MNLFRTRALQSALFPAVMVLFALSPVAALGAAWSAHAPSAKAVSLRVTDVRHVLGRDIIAVDARYNTLLLGECAATPPLTDYGATYGGSPNAKGVLSATSNVYAYNSAVGPACDIKHEIADQVLAHKAEHDLPGNTGTMSTVHGVGEQAYLLDAGPKTKERPEYTLSLNFARGMYRAIITVESKKPIKAADMIKLGKIVDARMRHTR
jgi:hypothetical protein